MSQPIKVDFFYCAWGRFPYYYLLRSFTVFCLFQGHFPFHFFWGRLLFLRSSSIFFWGRLPFFWVCLIFFIFYFFQFLRLSSIFWGRLPFFLRSSSIFIWRSSSIYLYFFEIVFHFFEVVIPVFKKKNEVVFHSHFLLRSSSIFFKVVFLVGLIYGCIPKMSFLCCLEVP